MALVVMALQAGLLLTLATLPRELPPRIKLVELLWAATRRPAFYPLVALLVAGPALTAVAWRVKGEHRPWLAVSWAVFGAVALLVYADRLALMLRVLWWQVQG